LSGYCQFPGPSTGSTHLTAPKFLCY